ncbi:MAG: hypothetical protein H6Q72_4838 [Firmicutes bacterium]|nr:hypothetical protein [Bacillota bacterium]
MNVSFAMISLDEKSPVRASDLTTNWISLSFFKQTTYRKILPETLGRK